MANGNKVKGTADVVFLMDTTDSMDYCIDAVKQNIRIFVQELQKERIDWRARIIGFRNYDYDRDKWIDADDAPFTSDLNELQRQLDKKEASGGDPDDTRESVLDALHYFAMLDVSPSMPPDPRKWRPTGRTAKCILLFTDAEFQEIVSYTPGNLELDDVGRALVLSRIRFTIVAPDYPCYRALTEYNGGIFIPCGNHEDFPKMRLHSADLTQQEKDEHRKTFEDIFRDFARTVSATAMEEVD